ncbi:hypothetical protein FRB94_008632 [Tulasnella sp. JGI-2019a]|nr:hypothetical protein FRB94_008632 [Tulasnella sp. JGI-2019a]
MDAQIFSSSPARPSHHRTQLPPKDAQKSIPIASLLPKTSSATTSNPLKRSASAANLLTPPSSPNKVRHRSKKGFTDSDEEDGGAGNLTEEDELESPEGRAVVRGVGGKGRKLTTRPMKGTVRTTSQAGPAASLFLNLARTTKTGGIKAEASTLRQQVDKMKMDSNGSPVTPGKSANASEDRMNISPARLPPRPTTPTPTWRMSKAAEERSAGPVRDSPNNPFLGSSPRIQAPKESVLEKPTVTYVFRGVKVVYQNPAHNIPTPQDGDPSTLPPQHPDFSPDLFTAPKLLWSSAPSAESDDDEDAAITSTMAPLKFRTAPQAGGSSPVRSSRQTNKRRRLTAPSEKEEDVFGGIQRTPEAMAL